MCKGWSGFWPPKPKLAFGLTTGFFSSGLFTPAYTVAYNQAISDSYDFLTSAVLAFSVATGRGVSADLVVNTLSVPPPYAGLKLDVAGSLKLNNASFLDDGGTVNLYTSAGNNVLVETGNVSGIYPFSLMNADVSQSYIGDNLFQLVWGASSGLRSPSYTCDFTFSTLRLHL